LSCGNYGWLHTFVYSYIAKTEFLEVGLTSSVLTFDSESNTTKVESSQIEHIIFQENVRRRNGIYCADERDNFAFGKSLIWPKEKIRNYLVKLINGADFLIFHSQSEFRYFRNLGIEIEKPVLDTQIIAATVGMKIPSLTRLLEHLSVPTSAMHNAGNDAYCTLLAFISLINEKSLQVSEEVFIAGCLAWEEEKEKKKQQEGLAQQTLSVETIFSDQSFTLTAANLRKQLPLKQKHTQKPADSATKSPFFLHRLLLAAENATPASTPEVVSTQTTRKRKFVHVEEQPERDYKRRRAQDLNVASNISSISLLAVLSSQPKK